MWTSLKSFELFQWMFLKWESFIGKRDERFVFRENQKDLKEVLPEFFEKRWLKEGFLCKTRAFKNFMCLLSWFQVLTFEEKPTKAGDYRLWIFSEDSLKLKIVKNKNKILSPDFPAISKTEKPLKAFLYSSTYATIFNLTRETFCSKSVIIWMT